MPKQYRQIGSGNYVILDEVPGGDGDSGPGCLGVIVLFFVLAMIGKGCDKAAKGAEQSVSQTSVVSANDPSSMPVRDRIILATGCVVAVICYAGKQGLAASVVSGILAWIYPMIALVFLGGGLLGLLWNLRRTHRHLSQPVETSQAKPEIIDAEFTRVQET